MTANPNEIHLRRCSFRFALCAGSSLEFGQFQGLNGSPKAPHREVLVP